MSVPPVICKVPLESSASASLLWAKIMPPLMTRFDPAFNASSVVVIWIKPPLMMRSRFASSPSGLSDSSSLTSYGFPVVVMVITPLFTIKSGVGSSSVVSVLASSAIFHPAVIALPTEVMVTVPPLMTR